MRLSRRAAGRLLGGLAAATAVDGSRSPAGAEATAAYDAWAAGYDDLDAADSLPARLFGLDSLRSSLVSRARGRVLEVGVGTGANLPLYLSGVSSVVGIDASAGMLARARERVRLSLPSIELQVADASALPFAAQSFDTVVCTFALCTFANPSAALRECARVLVPSGRLLLLEHAASASPIVRGYQDALAQPVEAMSKGVRWNLRLATLASAAGFEVVGRRDALAGTVVALELRLSDIEPSEIEESKL